MRWSQTRFMKKILTLSALAALAAPAGAAPTISAQSIIVNPLPSTVNVRVWTDRDSSGAATPDYAPGEKIRLYTSVAQDAYVYLFNVDPNGQVDLILPNKYQGGANFLKAGAVKVFLFTLVPAVFIAAVPARLVDDFDVARALELVSVAVVFALAAATTFTLGLRRYTSGNVWTRA